MEGSKVASIIADLFRPELIVYNISFLYIGMLFAPKITIATFIILTLAFMSARLGALTMNRYIGREIDLQNKKKEKSPHLLIPKNGLLAIFIIFSAVFLASCYYLNPLALALSPLVLAFFILDPMLKRHTSNRHFSVGLIESFSAIAGYIGVTGSIPATPALYLLMLAMIFIGSGFDIIYSIVHVEFDKKHRLNTYATKYGVNNALKVSAAFHAIAAVLLLAFAFFSGYYIIFLGAAVAAVILAMEHMNIKKRDDRDLMKRVMLYNPVLASILLLCTIIAVIL